jgi:hypothetical protein
MLISLRELEDLTWSIGGNVSTLKNEITELCGTVNSSTTTIKSW